MTVSQLVHALADQCQPLIVTISISQLDQISHTLQPGAQTDADGCAFSLCNHCNLWHRISCTSQYGYKCYHPYRQHMTAWHHDDDSIDLAISITTDPHPKIHNGQWHKAQRTLCRSQSRQEAILKHDSVLRLTASLLSFSDTHSCMAR